MLSKEEFRLTLAQVETVVLDSIENTVIDLFSGEVLDMVHSSLRENVISSLNNGDVQEYLYGAGILEEPDEYEYEEEMASVVTDGARVVVIAPVTEAQNIPQQVPIRPTTSVRADGVVVIQPVQQPQQQNAVTSSTVDQYTNVTGVQAAHTTFCPHCGNVVEDNAQHNFCPYCGYIRNY